MKKLNQILKISIADSIWKEKVFFLPQHFFHTLNANADIKALCQTSRIQEALDTFNYLLSSKSIPTLITCSILLSSLAQGKEHELGLFVYRLMIEADIVPDLITLNIVINCHCQTGPMDRVLKWSSMSVCDRILPSLITANQCSVPFMRTLNGTRQLVAWSLVEREVEIGMEFGAYYRDPWALS